MNILRPYSPLKAALDDACLTATEHQLHLASVLGKTPRWRLLNNGTAEFITTSGLIITTRIHPIGVLQNCVASPFCLPFEHDHPANSSLEFQPKERGVSVTPIQSR